MPTCTTGQTYTFTYTYNLAGSLATETYPSGRVVTTGYDAANRPFTTTGMLAGQQTGYNAQTGYAAQGAVASYAYGNSLVPVYTYNNRLQPKEIDATIGNDPNRYLLALTYDWGTARNNGTLQGGSEGYGPAVPYSSLSWFSQTYTYDGVNRLNSVSDTDYSRAFCSDAFGNIWVTGYTGIIPLGNTPQMIGSVCPGGSTPYDANNRINGGRYDAAGNQTLVNGNALLYDAENRLISETDSSTQAMETLAYDGEGRRVSKTNPGGTTIYVHDALGQLAAEYWTATNTPACTTCYLVWDHLGSTWLVTDSAATVIARHDYLPFGEEIGPDVRGSGWGSTTDVTQKFTGKERDQEMQLDYFGARYYGSALGRFTSPDWSEQPDTVPYAEFENPQTLNLYSYARNNPLTYNDPDGHDVNVCLNDENGNQHCTQMTNEQYAAASQGNAGTNVPTLDQVGMNGNGSGSFNATNITDSNGNSIGTATYVSNGGADYYANRNGINFLSYQTAPVVNGLAYATGGVMAGAGIGAGYGAFAGGSALITLGSIPAGLQPGAVVGGFVLTEHAVEQAAERGVTLQDIEEAVEGVAKGNPNPARAWDSVVRFYGANCEVRVNRITGTIVTVIKKSNK